MKGLEAVNVEDIPELERIAYEALYHAVDAPLKDKPTILSGIYENLRTWSKRPQEGVFLKYSTDERSVGFILVKEFWNVSDLFVLPDYHGKGVGRALLSMAMEHCEKKVGKRYLRVNASRNALRFYKALGFVETASDKPLPFSCVCLEYSRQDEHAE